MIPCFEWNRSVSICSKEIKDEDRGRRMRGRITIRNHYVSVFSSMAQKTELYELQVLGALTPDRLKHTEHHLSETKKNRPNDAANFSGLPIERDCRFPSLWCIFYSSLSSFLNRKNSSPPPRPPVVVLFHNHSSPEKGEKGSRGCARHPRRLLFWKGSK